MRTRRDIEVEDSVDPELNLRVHPSMPMTRYRIRDNL